MPDVSYPQRIHSVHVESMDGEMCVYDTARQRVHSLNHTAAFVWQRCDGRTAPAELAAALSAEAAIGEAEAVVHLTLQELAAAHLLEAPLEEVAGVSRRDLLRRGVTATAIPAIYSIVAPTPAAAQSPPPLAAPTLTSVSPNQGLRGETIAVTLTGTNFVVGATTVTVNSGGVTANNVIVGSTTSLTADIVIDLAAVAGAHSVTVTTAGGTSGAQTFTVSLPASGSTTFNYTGGPETFTVPAGVVSITILATGAQGGLGFEANGGVGGLGGRTTATVPVTPGASLTVRVGGVGPNGGPFGDTDGGFNGGGGSLADGGGGGGASSVRNGATPLVIVGGGGGGGASGGFAILPGGNGGAGGGLNANPGQLLGSEGGFPGGGGGQIFGGLGGFASTSPGTPGTDGMPDQGGVGGDQLGEFGGGGGGGGYRGGGGGGSGGASAEGGGGGGGGGSSFTAPGATAVLHEQGVKASNGFVTISW